MISPTKDVRRVRKRTPYLEESLVKNIAYSGGKLRIDKAPFMI